MIKIWNMQRSMPIIDSVAVNDAMAPVLLSDFPPHVRLEDMCLMRELDCRIEGKSDLTKNLAEICVLETVALLEQAREAVR